MARFKYQVREDSGNIESGYVDATDVSQASRQLRDAGKTIVTIIQEGSDPEDIKTYYARKKKVKPDEVIYFANQLAVMVDTGVPITDALDSIAEQTGNPGFQVVVEDLSARVKGGEEFSSALGEYPRIFSKLFVSLMRASEISGTMGKMLQRMSEYMAQERETRKRVKGAMTYPICMLSFSVIVVIALLVFILPRFESIYSGKGAVLPMPTRILMGLSSGLVTYWPLIYGGVVAAVIGLYFYKCTPGGRIFFDGLRINLPVLGGMYRKAYLARSFRTMSTMVSTGVSMLDGLEITSEVAGNHYFSEIWKQLSERVTEGSTLADPLLESKFIPRTITQMISAGERTGKLAPVLDRVASFCEEDLKVVIKTVTNMIEPVMIIVMGVLIGGIAMALLLPIFSISKVVAR